MSVFRAKEAQQLKAELSMARLAERQARERYQDFVRNSMYGVSEGRLEEYMKILYRTLYTE